jgi:hypothetical protein
MTMAISIPDGAACYFCLGEEGDEEGKPLVRDCSCRGNSGFAHLPCLIEYSKQKCRAAGDGDLTSFREPWHKCNNCKQPFQNQLAIDLASAFVSFAEATYGHDGNSKLEKMKVIESLRSKIESLGLNKLLYTNAGTQEELSKKILSMINQTKKDFKMHSWVHMPKDSEEYQYYKLLCVEYEAFAYKSLGGMLISDTSEEGFKIMITHYKKARAIYNLFGMKYSAQMMDTQISLCTAKKQATNDGTSSFTTAVPNSIVHTFGEIYERNIISEGMDSEDTIRSGVLYARVLQKVNCIDADRLVTKLATISRRVNGPDHKITIDAVELLEICKERYVIVLPENKPFQALRYKNDGEICVVQGPITKPRQVDEERIYNVEWNLVVPVKGCVVICHGLKSVLHMNGELGEVREVTTNGAGIRLAVQFEKKGKMSALVKPENLRIVFELPSK